MRSKVAILFAGLAFLTAVPASAESTFWQQSTEPTSETQTQNFEVQDVRFRRGGFRRGGFRRSRVRRGGFGRRGIRRGVRRGFKQRGFRKGFVKNSFGHGFGHKRVRSNFKVKHRGSHDFNAPGTVNESRQESSPPIEQTQAQTSNETSPTPVRSAEIISGGSGDASLFTTGVQEESAEQFLGVELDLVPEPKQN